MKLDILVDIHDAIRRLLLSRIDLQRLDTQRFDLAQHELEY